MDDPDEAVAATPEVAPAVATPAAPSTRGWTMLEELNESPAPVGAGVPMPAEQAAATAAPTSRGWTMFMEAELEGEKAAPVVEPEPEFYEGPVTTEGGTVVAFAPDAPARRATPVPTPLPAPPREEPMTSFAAKLRSEEEPISSFASKLRGEEEPAESLEELASATTEAVAATTSQAPRAAEVPSFAGAPPLEIVPPKAEQLSPIAPAPERARDDEEPTQGGGGKIVILLVGLVAVLAVLYFLFR